jgi:hypothetical protein
VWWPGMEDGRMETWKEDVGRMPCLVRKAELFVYQNLTLLIEFGREESCGYSME